jgi:DNA-binding MarR family transcriptional regulator
MYNRCYILSLTTDQPPRMLGTALRRLIELLDGDLERVYRAHGPGLAEYRASYTPVVRALTEADGRPLSVRAISVAEGVSHAAASATVSQMRRRGLLQDAPSRDGRERSVRLSASAHAMLPQLQAVWRQARQAEAGLDAQLGVCLADVVNAAVEAVEQRRFMGGDHDEPPVRAD